MQWFILAVTATLVLVFLCSLLEAMIFSTSVAEIAALKRDRPPTGARLETLKLQIDESISALLILNTLTTALGSVIIGLLAERLFDSYLLLAVMAGYALVLLIFSVIIPKAIGVAFRKNLQPPLTAPLWIITRLLRPIARVCHLTIRTMIPPQTATPKSDEEIILLAERGAQQGTLTKSESSIIANALSLNDIRVSEIMTPRTVVTMLRNNSTIGDVFREFPNIPFARIPVYGKNMDDIVGLVRRRDLLKAKANDQDAETVERLMQEINFVPETVTAANALQVFLRTHQQLLVAVDEFGATVGVVTMEDVMEHLLGREIFEKDDVAVDMRELARTKLQKQNRGKRADGGHASPDKST